MGFFEIKKLKYIGIPIPYFPVLLLLFGGLVYLWMSWQPLLFEKVLIWVLLTLPFIIPIALLGAWWAVWRQYVRAQYISQQTPVLLEFKIPSTIFKTPKAMEEVFNSLHVGPGETTFIGRWIDGKVRPWWSFEIVSLEGDVRMYVWTWKQFRSLVETAVYAQYPNVEIHETSDYTQGIQYDPGAISVFAAEFSLNPKKIDAYPIKTYIDLELDKESKKAEQIVDPLSSVFEKLSTFGVGKQLWIQIIIRQNKGAKKRGVFWFDKPPKWKEEAQDEIDAIYEDAKPKKKESVDSEDDGYPQLKPAQINAIKALERSIDKPGFDAAIRAVYIAEKDSFDGTKISSMLSIWNAFNTGQLNKIIPGGPWHTSLDYPWQKFRDKNPQKYSAEAIDAYRRRSYFHAPYESGGDRKSFILTSEELATLYHFPSEETRAPGLRRLASTKSDAPANLPT